MAASTALREIKDWSPAKRKLMLSTDITDYKQKFWISAAKEVCTKRRTAVFTYHFMEDYLGQLAGGTVLCFSAVLENDKVLLTLDEILRILKPALNEASGWMMSLIHDMWSNIYYTLFPRRDSSSESTDIFPTPTFAFPDLLKTLSEAVFEIQIMEQKHTLRLSAFLKEARDVSDDERTLQLMVLFLQKQSKCVVQKLHNGIQFVTFVEEMESFELPSNRQLQILWLDDRIEELRLEIDSATKEIQQWVKKFQTFMDKEDAVQAHNCHKLKLQKEFEKEQLSDELNNVLLQIDTLKRDESDAKKKLIQGSVEDGCLTKKRRREDSEDGHNRFL